MSGVELSVIIIGLLIGYWVVSMLDKKPEAKPTTEVMPDDTGASAAEAAPATPPWHEVLNVSASASLDEIRAAYKLHISQYHPDKVATLGDELRALAERKTKEIGAAYAEALRAHGIDEA
ncbi:MAG: DnaJ domain-containing protein [Pseudomonadota bacterium]